MALRAEQWLMLGVVGIGAYAIYRFSKTESTVTTTTGPQQAPPPMPIPGPAPNTPLPPNPGLPDRPTPIMLPPGNATIFGAGGPGQGNVMTLDNSRAYLGRGEDLTEADLGFLDAVRIFPSAEAARASGYPFPEWALAGASRFTRWFYGRYTFPDARYQKPVNLEAMWLTRGTASVPRVGALYPAYVVPRFSY